VTTNKLIFDEETHLYTLSGERLPSVTQVLEELKLSDFSSVSDTRMEAALDFGKAVHLATQYDDKKTLDENTLDEKIRPYINAWRSFKKDYRVRIKKIEQRVMSKKYRYAGTFDRVAIVMDYLSVVEIKTSVVIPKSACLQLVAYKDAYNSENPGRTLSRRYAVLLKDDGTYKVEDYRDPSDINVFLAALAIYIYKRR